MQTLLNITPSACCRGYEPKKQMTGSVAEKLQEEFLLSDSQSVSSTPHQHEAQLETESMFYGRWTVNLDIHMTCKLSGVHSLF